MPSKVYTTPNSNQTEDPFIQYITLQKTFNDLKVREDCIKKEYHNLKKEFINAKEEIKRIRSLPIAIGQFVEIIDQNSGIIQSNSGQNYYTRILSTLNRELLKANASISIHRHSNAVVNILPPQIDSLASAAAMTQRPDISFSDIGGLDFQKQEIREAVELPLTSPELYSSVGIDAPRGVLLYGPPGTGKTMMAKAVANATKATFIHVVGSEFVQKYLGEGARMVRNVFSMAKQRSENGAIIFIDEIDAIGTARYDAAISADREVQRILLELLSQMDGFDQSTNVKVIMATNRADTLDPALLRPGRLDRKIEFPLPDRRQRRMIFSVVTASMNLDESLDLESFVQRPERVSSADIAAICAEAGLRAIRSNRYMVTQKDFEEAYKKCVKRRDTKLDFYQ